MNGLPNGTTIKLYLHPNICHQGLNAEPRRFTLARLHTMGCHLLTPTSVRVLSKETKWGARGERTDRMEEDTFALLWDVMMKLAAGLSKH